MDQWWWVGEKLQNDSKFLFTASQTKQMSNESSVITNPTCFCRRCSSAQSGHLALHTNHDVDSHSLWPFGWGSSAHFVFGWLGRGITNMFHLTEGKDRLEKKDKKGPEIFSLRSPFESWSQFHSRALQHNRKCRSSQISRILQMLLEKRGGERRDLQAQAKGSGWRLNHIKPVQKAAGALWERCSHTRGWQGWNREGQLSLTQKKSP